jgi:hypothetical protein
MGRPAPSTAPDPLAAALSAANQRREGPDPETVAMMRTIGQNRIGGAAMPGDVPLPDPQATPTITEVLTRVRQWAQENPLDAGAIALSPVPIVGDVAGLLNDARHYATDPESRTAGNFALSVLGLLPFVPSAAGTLRKAAGDFAQAPEMLAKKGLYTYDPPVAPQRAFSEDYPNGASADPSGRLTTDRDGRPLNAPFVAGRRTPGGADEGLGDEQVSDVLLGLAGRNAEVTADRRLIGTDAGRTVSQRTPEGTLDQRVYLHGDLTPEQFPRVYAHETAHVINNIARKIPTDGLMGELKAVYDRLNRPGGGKPVTPEAMGYKGADVPQEYIAEAIRAYLVNPNYLKTVAPKTAAKIRAEVNADPQISRVVQFNTLAPLMGFGAAGALSGQNTETPPAP